MTAAPGARSPSAARHWLLDGGIALAAFGGTVALLSHGLGSSGNVKHHLDALGVLLAACATFPLLAWRRAPLAVFILTTAASAASMARGYPGGPPVGPTIALYLLAASRDPRHPWTRQITEIVVGMFCRAHPRVRAGPRPGAGRPDRVRRARVGTRLVRRRAHPATPPAAGRARGARAARRAGGGARAPPGGRPRSARGSPATCTTPPATRST